MKTEHAVRWTRPYWNPERAPSIRRFARGGDALRFHQKLTAEGCTASIQIREVGDWQAVETSEVTA